VESQTQEEAGQRPASRLDMARVQRWAELLDGDPQARQFMREHVAGGELTQLNELAQRSRRLELALKHGIPEKLAEVHLTSDDPALLEAQAESLAQLLQNQSPVAAAAGRRNNNGDVPSPPLNKIFESPATPLPVYEAAPVSGDEWLQQQFVRLYEQ
jgi:hypothetical protein